MFSIFYSPEIFSDHLCIGANRKRKMVEGRSKGRNAYFYSTPSQFVPQQHYGDLQCKFYIHLSGDRSISIEAFTAMGKYFHFPIWKRKWSKHILFSSDNGIHSESQWGASMCIVISHLGETSNVTNECEISYARIPLVDEGAEISWGWQASLQAGFPEEWNCFKQQPLTGETHQGYFTERVSCVSS